MKNFVLVIALAALVALMPASLTAQQTVNPSGACRMDSQVRFIHAPGGIYMCLPSSAGAATGTWTLIDMGTVGSTMGMVTVGYTINYNNATLAGSTTTAAVSLPALPAGAVIVGCRIEVMTKPAATSLSALTVSIGDSTAATAYSAAYDTFVAVSNTSLAMGTPAYKITGKTAVTPLATFTPTGANLSALSAGQWKITISYVSYPASFTVVTL
jgi:hypothetical protein